MCVSYIYVSPSRGRTVEPIENTRFLGRTKVEQVERRYLWRRNLVVKTAYVWDNITVATRELEEYLNQGYKIVSSALYEEADDFQSTLIFAAVLVKEDF